MRYFIHVRAGDHRVTDDIGEGFDDFPSARAEAVEAAAEIIRVKLQLGEVMSPTWSIEIADQCGHIIETLPLERIVFGAAARDR